MKNYFLTKDVFLELLYGTKLNKEKIVSTLEDLFKKNGSLFISINSLNQILEQETHLKKRKTILENIDLLCEKILPLDKDDLPIIIGIETEFGINHSTAIELLIAKNAGMDFIIDTTEKFKFQKMISVISLILKTE
jgi:hypothetical protein